MIIMLHFAFHTIQVNLSHEVHSVLVGVLGGDDMNDEQIIKKFESYEDFLRLFDGAVIEAYRLMVNVYGYRFRKYVKDRFPDATFE